MVRRKKIALAYYYSENWIAGSYYMVNMIKAINRLPDSQKPWIFILIKNYDGLDLINDLHYPYLKFINHDVNTEKFPLKIFRKVLIKVCGKDLWLQWKFDRIDCVFEDRDEIKGIKRHFYWVHDFQEFRLPFFFTPEEKERRSSLPRKVANMPNATIVVSSYDAENDFKTYFPGYKCAIKVFRFTSSLPDFSAIDIFQLQNKYDISYQYFICSNQFWQHKNHKVVLDAINILKSRKYKFHVVFTGKNFDYRNPEYFSSLVKYVEKNELSEWVRFLGFVEREEQLQLAKHSISYIQPSLFEGWSTTVEDAKCMNQHIILSDIPVHREQLQVNVDFFDPSSASELASIMENLLLHGVSIVETNYDENILQYGKDIMAAFT